MTRGSRQRPLTVCVVLRIPNCSQDDRLARLVLLLSYRVEDEWQFPVNGFSESVRHERRDQAGAGEVNGCDRRTPARSGGRA